MGEFIFADKYILDTGKTRDFYLEFMKGLVHKSNNLVGVVQGFGSLILLEDDLDETVRENTEQMDTAARSMSDLNKKVLTASGCGKVDMSSTQLQDMFRFLEGKANEICDENGVSCDFEANPGLPNVMIDNNRFSEVFEELVRNAAESAAESSLKAIKIEFFAPGAATSTGHVDLFIRNTSPKIESHEIPKMFEAFHGSKGNDHFGIGLTLAAVVSGQMDIRLGLKTKGEQMTTWLAIPTA